MRNWIITALLICGVLQAGQPVVGPGGTAAANTVMAGPASGGAVQPGYRALVHADMPSLITSRASVRVATTAALTLATDFENGDTVDGVVLATGDRILIKNQASSIANGIYVVAASGAPARATDSDTAAEVDEGTCVFVSDGSANNRTLWTQVTLNPTLGVSSLVYDKTLTTKTAVTVAEGGTGIATGTSGGIPYFSSSSTIASSGALTQYGVVVGGGAAATPVTTSAGATNTVLHGMGSANPVFSVVTPSDAAGNTSGSGNFALVGSPTFTGTPLAPTAATGTNTTQVATTAFVQAASNNNTYRTIMRSAGNMIATQAVGTFRMPAGGQQIFGTGNVAYSIATINYVAADYPTVDGKATKLRLRAQLQVNDAAPTSTFTIGLFPVSAAFGTAGAIGYTLGAEASGTTDCSFVAPAALSSNVDVSSEFTPPSDGVYCIGVVLTAATIATSSFVTIQADLQMRNP